MKKNILIACLSLVLALAIAELVLRWVGVGQVRFSEKPRMGWVNVPENSWVEYHPVLGWYSQKNKTALLDSQNFQQVIVHTNSAGFRGAREYAVPKPSGVFRVAAIGDSFVFGFGVQDPETYSALLESQSQSREVLNLGVPGYGIDQIYLSYREVARKYRPDLVLVGIFPEDFWRCTRSFADSGHVKPYFTLSPNGKLVLHNVPVPPPFSLNRDQFPPLLERNSLQKILDRSVLYRLAAKPLTRLARNMRLIDPDTSEEWIVGRAILRQFIRELKADGVTPVFILIPPHDWVTTSRKTSLEKSWERFVAREKVLSINLTPAFREAVAKDGLEAYYIKGDWHWTPQGHALAARMIQSHAKA